MLDWAGRDDDFEAEEFDVLVEAFSLDLALAPGACPATRHRSRRHGRDKQHHPRSTGAMRAHPAARRSSTAANDINTLAPLRRTTDVNYTTAHSPDGSLQPLPRGFLPVAPGLAKTFMKLFVNRLSYCEQSPYGDHRYHRPKHPELKTLAGRRAAMEMPGQKWGSLPHTDRTNENRP